MSHFSLSWRLDLIFLFHGDIMLLTSNLIVHALCATFPTTTLSLLLLLETATVQPPPLLLQHVQQHESLMSMYPSLLAETTTTTADRLSIVQVIQVYGRLASRDCYGLLAPVGSSCQLTRWGLYSKLRLVDRDSGINRDEFERVVQEQSFGWPLKPFGVAGSSSVTKTATMNKGVETRIYNQLLERYQLYNPHNPASPLPTSLRPQLDDILQSQDVDAYTIDAIYDRLVRSDTTTSAAGASRTLTREQLDQLLFSKQDALDFYEFVDLLGVDNISWNAANSEPPE